MSFDCGETRKRKSPGCGQTGRSGKLESLHSEGNVGQSNFSSTDDDIQSVYSYFCQSVPKNNTMRITQNDSLFCTTVLVQDKVELTGILDSGSMATTLRADIVPRLREAGVVEGNCLAPSDIILVDCGGRQTSPVGMWDFSYVVPVLIADEQVDELIVGTNVLKSLIRQFKSNDSYWRVVGTPGPSGQCDDSQFLHLLSNLERWRGDSIPDKVGTIKLENSNAPTHERASGVGPPTPKDKTLCGQYCC
jgi:hypothetical protein